MDLIYLQKLLKTKNKINEQAKQNHIDREIRVVVTRGKGLGEGGRGCCKMGKGDQLYGDRWKLNFWWWVHCSSYRSRNIILYT